MQVPGHGDVAIFLAKPLEARCFHIRGGQMLNVFTGHIGLLDNLRDRPGRAAIARTVAADQEVRNAEDLVAGMVVPNSCANTSSEAKKSTTKGIADMFTKQDHYISPLKAVSRSS